MESEDGVRRLGVLRLLLRNRLITSYLSLRLLTIISDTVNNPKGYGGDDFINVTSVNTSDYSRHSS